MLTANLVRATFRKGEVRPRYIDPSQPALIAEAERLVAVFEAHVGKPLGELNETLADEIGDSTDYLQKRGLAKLLMDRATVETRAARPPSEIREAVFRHAATRWPVIGGRADATSPSVVLEAAAAELGLTPDEVESGLFADLKDAEIITAVEPMAPVALLERYNMALAQAVLLKARRVVVRLSDTRPARARQLFRFIKFRQLMHTASRTPDGYEIVLDGPLSLFRQTQRYGLQLALFLPCLALCERFSLEAEVAWRQVKDATFKVDQDTGLKTHLRAKGSWRSREEEHFEATWRASDTPWKLRRATRIIDLDGRGVLIPDYSIRHPDGREALLDIVWFWRKDSFRRRIALLREAGPSHLIVALATRLNVDSESPEIGAATVYPFKGVIQPKRIIALAEAIAFG